MNYAVRTYPGEESFWWTNDAGKSWLLSEEPVTISIFDLGAEALRDNRLWCEPIDTAKPGKPAPEPTPEPEPEAEAEPEPSVEEVTEPDDAEPPAKKHKGRG